MSKKGRIVLGRWKGRRSDKSAGLGSQLSVEPPRESANEFRMVQERVQNELDNVFESVKERHQIRNELTDRWKSLRPHSDAASSTFVSSLREVNESFSNLNDSLEKSSVVINGVAHEMGSLRGAVGGDAGALWIEWKSRYEDIERNVIPTIRDRLESVTLLLENLRRNVNSER